MAKRFPVMIFIRKMHDSKLPYVYDYSSTPNTLKRIIGTQSPKKADFNLSAPILRKEENEKKEKSKKYSDKDLGKRVEYFMKRCAVV